MPTFIEDKSSWPETGSNVWALNDNKYVRCVFLIVGEHPHFAFDTRHGGEIDIKDKEITFYPCSKNGYIKTEDGMPTLNGKYLIKVIDFSHEKSTRVLIEEYERGGCEGYRSEFRGYHDNCKISTWHSLKIVSWQFLPGEEW